MPKTGSTLPKALRDAFRACRYHFALAAGFSAGVNILYFAPPLYMMQVYDRVIPTAGEMTLVFVSIIALLALMTLAALDALRQSILARMAARLDRLLSTPVVLAQFAGRHVSALAPGVRQLDMFRAAMTGPGALAVLDAPWTPLFLIVVFVIHPWLGVFVLAGAVLLVAITALSQIRLRSDLIAADSAAAVASARTEASAALAGAGRALGMQRALAVKHTGERGDASRKAFSATVGAGAVGSLTKFLRLVLQSGVLGLGAYLAIEGQISAGAVFAASILAARTLQPIEQLVGGWRSLIQGLAAYESLRRALASAENEGPRTPLPAPAGVIEVQQLIIAVGDGRAPPVVKGVSFRVGPGEVAAIVGPSGAGKSTLGQAIVGAIAAQAGVVRIDGGDIRHWDPELLGPHIGYLPQEVGLFEGTIADNISRFRRWRGEAPEELGARIVTAAKAAGAHELIQRLPLGYDTPLGPGGRGVSGGQAQRIALARAMFDEPAILVLDEPNAFLDSEGEQALLRSLEAVKARGGSAIVIAQRVGVLAACDRMIVMRDGRIELDGPRDQVLMNLRATQVGQTRPATAVEPPKPEEAA